MIVYKLTTQDGKTRPGKCSETQWGENVEHVALGGTLGICGYGWLHAYHSPAMAAMMNVDHANIYNPVCWECDADVAEDHGDKLLCTRIKTLNRVDLPEIPPEQRVEIAIRAAMVVYDEPSWVTWAQNWLNGTDRLEIATRKTMQKTPMVLDASTTQDLAARSAWSATWAAEALLQSWTVGRASSQQARVSAARSLTDATKVMAKIGAGAETSQLGKIINSVLQNQRDAA